MGAFKRGRLAGPVLIPCTTADFILWAVNAATSAVEWVFQAEEPAVITKVGFRYGARTGTPPAYIISIQGVDASGNPDGTIKGGGSPASHVFTPPANTSWDGTWQWITLDNSYTCTRGEWIALVVGYSSGTVNSSNTGSFTQYTRLNNTGVTFYAPYSIANNAGVRTRAGSSYIAGYQSATTSYGRPISAVNTANIRNDTGIEMALSFNVPLTMVDTYKVAGVYIGSAGIAAAGSIRIQLYDTDGTTVLQTVNWDTDYGSGVGVGGINVLFQEATLATLVGGGTYRIGLFGLTSGVAASINYLDVPTAADMSALWGGGITYGCFFRTAGTGAWTTLATRRITMDLIIDDWSLPPPKGGGAIVGSSIVRPVLGQLHSVPVPPVVTPPALAYMAGLVPDHTANQTDPAFWPQDSTLPGDTTYIGDVSQRVRAEGCPVRHIGIRVATGGSGWKFKVFRPNGSNFDFVQQSPPYTLSTGFQTVDVALSVRAGDVIAVYVPTSCAIGTKTTSTLAVKSAAGDITSTNAFSTTAASNSSLSFWVQGDAPFICGVGDSIMSGYSGWATWYDTGPAGTRTNPSLYSIWTANSRYTYQDGGKSGAQTSFALSTSIPDALLRNPTAILLHSGVNSIPGINLTSLTSCYNLLSGYPNVHLFVDEVLPWTNGTDANNVEVRNYNASLPGWASTRPQATIVSCHDAMGQTRVSTGQLDDLIAAYSLDGVHPNAAGYVALAALQKAALDAYYP